jgi:hypothetical protein
VITKVIAVELATVVTKVLITYADLMHAASKVALEAASAGPLT